MKLYLKKGFTLIELMTVVVIIGILTAVAIPNFIAMRDRAQEASLKSNMHTLHLVVEMFNTYAFGLYPGSIDTKVKDVYPMADGTPFGEYSIAEGARKPPFPLEALLRPHDAFRNPYDPGLDAVNDLFMNPPVIPIPPMGCSYYTGLNNNGHTNLGESADFYRITGYARSKPLDFSLP
ncbi:MAG: type II secretion system protein [candidate division WOR-3 bacterium]